MHMALGCRFRLSGRGEPEGTLSGAHGRTRMNYGLSQGHRSSAPRSPCPSRTTAWRARATVVPVAEPADVRIGLLGLGIMGRPMAMRLIRAGYDVVVWNRTPEACDDLAAGGVQVADSPAAVAEACDITLAMLADPQACMEVAFGKNGAVEGLSAGKGYIDASTVDVLTAQRVEHSVQSAGASFLEAPVSGSKGPAEQGKLIFMTAGDLGLYQSAVPLFKAMGKMHVYLGETGLAAKMKLVVNMMMGSMMAAFSEGLLLSEAAGLRAEDLLKIVNESAIASPMLALKGPQMINKEFPPAFPLKHQQKDMRLALRLGGATGQYLPIAAAANELYLRAKLHGLGDLDFSAVIKALHRGDL